MFTFILDRDLLYIVLTLEGYTCYHRSAVGKATRESLRTFARIRDLTARKILNNYISYFARDGDKIPD